MSWSIDRVNAYYEELHDAYRLAWGIERNLSIHFGYHDGDHRGHDAALINMNRVMSERAGISSGDRVLDAGCGVGGSSIWLAREVGAEVMGISVNEMQVGLARELARERGIADRVSFVVGDFTATGLADDSFDVIWGLESICYAERKGDFVREAARLLRAGGRIIVADGFLSNREFTPDERADLYRWIDGWAAPNLARVDEFEGYLRDAGFAEIEYEDITKAVMPSSRRIHRTSLLSLPVGKLLGLLGLRSAVQRAASVASRFQYPTLTRGLWQYGIFCADLAGH